MLPAPLLRAKVLKPMRFMAGGTVQAAVAALEHGWAVNLGGGMHHAFFDDGGGWCCFDDISLALCLLHEASQGEFHRGMIIDLDVHQGNGHERSKLHRQKQHGVAHTHSFKHPLETFIVDVYNAAIYPRDVEAKAAIDVGVHLRSGAGDDEFLEAVDRALKEAFDRYPEPQLVVYNAGTDVLSGDPLGLMQVTEAAVLKRDEMVWDACLRAKAPVVMLLSGGYTAQSTPCIAHSLENLIQRFDLWAL